MSYALREIAGIGFLCFVAYVWLTNRAMGIRGYQPDMVQAQRWRGRLRRAPAPVAQSLLRPSQAPEATAEMLVRPAACLGGEDSALLRSSAEGRAAGHSSC